MNLIDCGRGTLEMQLQELTSQQSEEDKTLIKLRKEKVKLLESFPSSDTSSHNDVPLFDYILSLLEDVYWLELKEKEIKQEYEKKLLSLKAQHLGQDFLSLSMTSEKCVLKPWFEELTKLKDQQPKLLSLSSEKGRLSSIHNIGYNGRYSASTLTENLAFTVLCETVQVGIKLRSELPCHNKHQVLLLRANLSVWSDMYIPKLEEIVTQSVQDCSSISNVISHVVTQIMNDVAPYVIGLPLRKIKKKKAVKKTSDSLMSSISEEADSRGDYRKDKNKKKELERRE